MSNSSIHQENLETNLAILAVSEKDQRSNRALLESASFQRKTILMDAEDHRSRDQHHLRLESFYKTHIETAAFYTWIQQCF